MQSFSIRSKRSRPVGFSPGRIGSSGRAVKVAPQDQRVGAAAIVGWPQADLAESDCPIEGQSGAIVAGDLEEEAPRAGSGGLDGGGFDQGSRDPRASMRGISSCA